jgi:CelD/BcsL family acetyltransferase involved in cellulose biosynthesis
MLARSISILDLSATDERAWRDLAARSVEPNPFYEVDFLVPACRHLRGGKGVALLVAEESGRFHACLPVRPRRRIGADYLPLITSWRHPYGYLGTPLVAPERAVDALGCLVGTLRSGRPWPRVVVLELFGDWGPTAAYLRRAADQLGVTVYVHASGDRAILRCQDDGGASLPARVKRERQAKVRRWRRLSADRGEPAVVDRAAQSDSAERFLAMEASGWKGQSGTALLSRPKDAAFYREVTSRFAAAHRLRLYSLEVDAETLAMQTNLSADDCLFDWKVAYDERFSRYGPGTLLQLRVLDLARADGVQWIDTCAAVGDDHQLRLSGDGRRIATLAVAGRGEIEAAIVAPAVWIVSISGKLRGVTTRNLRFKLARVTERARRR